MTTPAIQALLDFFFLVPPLLGLIVGVEGMVSEVSAALVEPGAAAEGKLVECDGEEVCGLTRCCLCCVGLDAIVGPVDTGDTAVHVGLWAGVVFVLIHEGSVADSEGRGAVGIGAVGRQ